MTFCAKFIKFNNRNCHAHNYCVFFFSPKPMQSIIPYQYHNIFLKKDGVKNDCHICKSLF